MWKVFAYWRWYRWYQEWLRWALWLLHRYMCMFWPVFQILKTLNIWSLNSPPTVRSDTYCNYLSHWWASSSDTLIYPSIFAFPSLSLHRRSTTMHLRSNATTLVLARQSHSLHWTDLAYLMDIWLMIHMYSLLFLVSPTCPSCGPTNHEFSLRAVRHFL